MKNLKNIGLGLATLFFAFSVVFSMSSFKGEKIAKSTDLYWYEVNESNILINQLNIIKVDKNEAMNGTNPLTSCEDDGSDYCIVGYEEEQDLFIVAPTPASPDHVVTFDRP